MNVKELEHYKKLLLAKREELTVAQKESAPPMPAAGEAAGDLIDRAVADAEAELQIQLRQADGRVLAAIEGALERMRAGTFGVCEACGEPIARARLDAVPWTRHCRKCEEQGQPPA